MFFQSKASCSVVFSKLIHILIFALPISIQVGAQGITFTTQVPANKMGIDDYIQVRYELQNVHNAEKYYLQGTTDFQPAGGASIGNNISTFNGEISASMSFTYAFKPNKIGKLKLPQCVVVVQGRKYVSNLINIDVVKGSLAARGRSNPRDNASYGQDPFQNMVDNSRRMRELMRKIHDEAWGKADQSPNAAASTPKKNNLEPTRDNLEKNLFIRVEVDKTKVLVGEQVTASYKLYSRIPTRIQLTKLPTLNHFWTQDFDIPSPPKPVREDLDGVPYQVILIKKSALFPTQAGDLVLDAAEGEGVARIRKSVKMQRKNPFRDLMEDDPFFGSSFSSLFMDDPFYNDAFVDVYNYEDIDVKLKSKDVIIHVEEPQHNKPENYSGAVGQYTMESNINATEMTTDDIGILTLTIRGSGNIKLISPPSVAFSSNVDAFEPLVKDTITGKKNNKISGYKTISYRFTPNASGVMKIPPITFTYYDPERQKFDTLKTPEYTLTIKPGRNNKSALHKLPSDIHDIADENTNLFSNATNNLLSNPLYWSAYAVPSLLFLGLLAFKKKEEKEKSNVALFKNKRANKVALKRMAQAEKHLRAGEQNKFFEESAKAIWLYLSDKLNIPLANLSKEIATSLLEQKKVKPELLEELFLITEECELALYSPDSGNIKMNQVYSDGLKLIGKLEDDLN